MILFQHQSVKPTPRPLVWGGVLLLFFSAALTYVAPVVGLGLLGALLLIAGISVEMNADQIWAESLKFVKKNHKNIPWYNRPNQFFHIFNTYVLWPFVMLLGLTCLVLAYRLI
jgi:hypothetical protein